MFAHLSLLIDKIKSRLQGKCATKSFTTGTNLKQTLIGSLYSAEKRKKSRFHLTPPLSLTKSKVHSWWKVRHSKNSIVINLNPTNFNPPAYCEVSYRWKNEKKVLFFHLFLLCDKIKSALSVEPAPHKITQLLKI